MNTFLPYPDFDESAACLDWQRLGKQRVEVLQLLRGSWSNHPASRMWSQHLGSLAEYGTVICWEWCMRGYRDGVLDQIEELVEGLGMRGQLNPPPWLGDDRVHSAMRASLLAKDYQHYRQFGWTELPAYGYRWDLCTLHLQPVVQQVVQCAWETQASAQGSCSVRCNLPVVIGGTLCAEHHAMLERSKQS